jgi:hypothetical protein
LGVNFLGFDVDDVHFLSDALQGGFGAECCNVGSDESVGIFGDGLQINVFGQLHVLGVNSENLEAANLVRNSNVDLSVEPAESSQSWVDCVGSVGCSDNNNMASAFESVHECEQL